MSDFTLSMKNVKTTRTAKRLRFSSLPRKKCPVCGQIFLPSQQRVGFCSVRCANKSKSKPTKECEVCRIQFTPRYDSQQFCTQKCRKTYYRKEPTRRCSHCKRVLPATTEFFHRQQEDSIHHL